MCRRGNTGVEAGSGGKSAARFDAFATFTEATVGYRLQGTLRLDALPNGTPLVKKRTVTAEPNRIARFDRLPRPRDRLVIAAVLGRLGLGEGGERGDAERDGGAAGLDGRLGAHGEGGGVGDGEHFGFGGSTRGVEWRWRGNARRRGPTVNRSKGSFPVAIVEFVARIILFRCQLAPSGRVNPRDEG